MTPHAARDLADRAIGFIAADPDLTAALLAASGAGPAALRRMAETPEFPLFLVDFLLEDEARVLAFAAAEGLPPGSILAARAALEGPGEAWEGEAWDGETGWP